MKRTITVTSKSALYILVLNLITWISGAPYTGLKPAGTDFGPVIPAGDHALETGSLKELRNLIVEKFEAGLHAYFDEMMEAKEFDTNDIEAGREFVHKYVEYMHYAEPVYNTVKAEEAANSAHNH